mmetsp:Transcript_4519/g.10926  ORF Transcript_4519/g.10926 Transcript_4519/m.10926 type:complete len:316 (+) Transcript_4519:180-1127(+)
MTPNVILTEMISVVNAKNENNHDPELGLSDGSMDSNSVKEGDSSWSSKQFPDDGSTATGHSPDTSNNHSKGEMSEESLDIARKENLLVTYWRFLMFFVLFAVTVTVGVVVYDLVRKSQFQDFDSAFKVDSEKIYESIGFTIDQRLEAIDAMATMMVTGAKLRNETWPFTAMPDFPSKASKMRMLSDAVAIQQYMFVEEHERSQYEAFAKANEGWVQDTIEVMREDTTLRLQVEVPDYDTNHSTSIRSGPDPVPDNSGPYFPTWNTYPIVPSGTSSAYNWNAIQHPTLGPGIVQAFTEHKVVIGPVLNYAETKEEM